MQIILLSGGSGTRLWPLSNDSHSKQFLRILDGESGREPESMVQRVYRQLRETNINADLTVATSEAQKDSVLAHLGSNVDIVTEPERRDTFPAIALACEYLSKEKHCGDDEVIIVMPCDPYTHAGYFKCIAEMAEATANSVAEMMVMGITPTYASAKYGYILPGNTIAPGIAKVNRFTEKPDIDTAAALIEQGALWNGGVFAFRLGYLTAIARRYNSAATLSEIRRDYHLYPKISFDYEVAEKAADIGMVQYTGQWKDLGTWNTLTDELSHTTYGNVITDGTTRNTHIFNDLKIPLLCLGTENLIVAASPDGILVAEKGKSEKIKEYAAQLKHRPMFEERRWGSYRVIDNIEFPDGYCALTKQITLHPGCAISYQRHSCRDEVWSFINGEGEIVINGERRTVKRGDVVNIPMGHKHAIKAETSLTFIEVQKGRNLIEEDIERFDYDWDHPTD